MSNDNDYYGGAESWCRTRIQVSSSFKPKPLSVSYVTLWHHVLYFHQIGCELYSVCGAGLFFTSSFCFFAGLASSYSSNKKKIDFQLVLKFF